MFPAIYEWLIDKAPLLVFLVVFALIIWKISQAYFTRLIPMEKQVNDLKQKSNCVQHGNEIAELKGMIRNIERILLKSDNSLMDQLSLTRSPRQLSPIGYELFEISGCKRLLEKNKDYYIEKLESRKPVTALDVETEAHSLLLSLSDEELFKPVKGYIYNNPKFKENDIDINTICFVMSLELRNLFLAKHQEIIVDL